MTDTATLILRDRDGAYYLLTPELLAQARATTEEQVDLERAIAEDDATGYAAGGAEFVLIGQLLPAVSPRDPASGLPTGKRMHKPFVIMKEIDKASPLL